MSPVGIYKFDLINKKIGKGDVLICKIYQKKKKKKINCLFQI